MVVNSDSGRPLRRARAGTSTSAFVTRSRARYTAAVPRDRLKQLEAVAEDRACVVLGVIARAVILARLPVVAGLAGDDVEYADVLVAELLRSDPHERHGQLLHVARATRFAARVPDRDPAPSPPPTGFQTEVSQYLAPKEMGSGNPDGIGVAEYARPLRAP